MVVRVIRTLEYTYASQEECDKDMGRWHIPPMGVRHYLAAGTAIRSSVMFPEPILMPSEGTKG
jgi:hypothetical protein